MPAGTASGGMTGNHKRMDIPWRDARMRDGEHRLDKDGLQGR